MAKKHCSGEGPFPAVAYLRKSTKGKRADGKKLQENSISNQRIEIEQLAKQHNYRIVRWYTDEGKSGWKLGAKRPAFKKLLDDVERLQDVTTVVVDDLDRFSRAKVMQTFGVYSRLAENGVKLIHSVNDGKFLLDDKDIGTTITLVVKTHGANAFAHKLSNRIAETRRNRAYEGLRSGGQAPYGMENDGKGGLCFGDPVKVAVVKRMFTEFAVKCRSMNSIAGSLNADGIPARRGGIWHVATIKEILTQRAYAGEFTYNLKKSGQFFVLDAEGHVVEVDDENRPSPTWKKTEVGVIAQPSRYEPLIDPKLFQQAQDRLASFTLKGDRRPRENGYPLSRILICDHCGKPMYGCHPTGRKYRVYRCSTPAKSGMGTCGMFEIREEVILPFVMRLLGEEIRNVEALLRKPPDNLRFPDREALQHRESLELAKAELASQVSQAEENLLFVADARTRKSLDGRISVMRDRLDSLDSELACSPAPKDGYSYEERQALLTWWEEFERTALRLPVVRSLPPVAHLYLAKDTDEAEPQELLVSPREVNEVLYGLGAELRLRWKTDKTTLANGKQRSRHTLVRGRLRLGPKTLEMPRNVLQSTANRALHG